LLLWDKNRYTERFLALLACTCILQPKLVHLYQAVFCNEILPWCPLLLSQNHNEPLILDFSVAQPLSVGMMVKVQICCPSDDIRVPELRWSSVEMACILLICNMSISFLFKAVYYSFAW
jgi:hypothetical protein